jgi:hypothetical protein
MTNDPKPSRADRRDKAEDGAVEAPYGDDQERTTGQSGGGSYPNGRSKTAAKGKQGSFMGHGGQSEIRYHGGADEEASGKDANSVTQNED